MLLILTSAVYPHLVVIYDFSYFSLFKIWGNSAQRVHELWLGKQTNRETNRDFNFIYNDNNYESNVMKTCFEPKIKE